MYAKLYTMKECGGWCSNSVAGFGFVRRPEDCASSHPRRKTGFVGAAFFFCYFSFGHAKEK
jgi:hypothetical protein